MGEIVKRHFKVRANSKLATVCNKCFKIREEFIIKIRNFACDNFGTLEVLTYDGIEGIYVFAGIAFGSALKNQELLKPHPRYSEAQIISTKTKVGKHLAREFSNFKIDWMAQFRQAVKSETVYGEDGFSWCSLGRTDNGTIVCTIPVDLKKKWEPHQDLIEITQYQMGRLYMAPPKKKRVRNPNKEEVGIEPN